MVQSGRIDISGQTGMCDTSRVEISRSMPSIMEGRMNDFAWKSFCDKMDEALESVTKAKKIMVCFCYVSSCVCGQYYILYCWTSLHAVYHNIIVLFMLFVEKKSPLRTSERLC